MIKGMHGMFYSSEADALRTFIREKLQFPFTDIGHGWLIFEVPSADLGCHPSEGPHPTPAGTHNISFYTDDIKKTVKELKARGVKFTREIRDDGFGLTIDFTMPGGVQVMLYQPSYKKGTKKKARAK